MSSGDRPQGVNKPSSPPTKWGANSAIAFICVCLWLALAACTPRTAAPTPVATVTATLPAPEASITPAATATASVTPTALPASPGPRPSPSPTPVPPLPPGLGNLYQSDRLGVRLPYPDGWTAYESAVGVGFGPDADHARTPAFAEAPGVILSVYKRKTVALALGRPDVTAADVLSRALVSTLPDAPAPEIRPLVIDGASAAESYLSWIDPDTGTRVVIYALALDAGARGIVLIAGAPLAQWLELQPRFTGMAARLELRPPAIAPGAPENDLYPGDWAPGRLSPAPHTYQFTGEAGDYVTLTALSDAASDPALALYDPQGALLAQDDDSGVALSAVVSDVPLVAEGVYRVVVWDGSGRGGDFSVQLLTAPAPSGGGPLRPDESLAGSLAQTGVRHEWQFEARTGAVIALEVTRLSGDVLLSLSLIAPDGQALAEVSGGPAARIAEFPLRARGTYVARVQALQGTGDYTVQLHVLAGASGGGELGRAGAGGTLAPATAHAWTLSADAPGLVITADAPVRVEAFDLSGVRVAWARSDVAARVAGRLSAGTRVNVFAPDGATYRVEVTAPEAAGGGGPLALDELGQGALNPGDVQRWTFPGGAGQIVRVALDGDDALVPYLGLYAPGGARLALLAAGGGDLLVPELPLVVTGTYTLEIGALTGAGPYVLRVSDVSAEASGGGAMAYGDSAFGELAPGARHAWTFTGAPGDTLAVTVRRGVGDLAPEIAVYAPSGKLLATATADADGVAVIETFALEESGAYTIIVGGAGVTSGDYQITIE
jgi:hypothetical protein